MFGEAVLLLVVLAAFLGCGGAEDVQNMDFGSSGGTSVGKPSYAGTRCHFPSFEVCLPEPWQARGNTTQELTSAEEVVFGFAGESEAPEKELCRVLCLFRSTEYYPDQITVTCEGQTPVPGGKRVTGTLYNGRLQTTLSFCGYHFPDTAGFWVFLSPDPESAARTEELADELYQTYQVL